MQRLLVEFIDTLDATFTDTLRVTALEAGHDDLTVAQLRLISTVQQLEDPTPSSVADALGISRASVTEQVARLERRGLLTRIPSVEDGRSVHLRLSPSALRLVAARDEALRSFEHRIRTALGPEGSEALASLMARLLDHLRSEPGPRTTMVPSADHAQTDSSER